MNLSPREMDKLYIHVVADLARRRRDRGLQLNHGEAVALISEAVVEGARDGRTVAECMQLGRQVLTSSDVMPGVREMTSSCRWRPPSSTAPIGVVSRPDRW